jgi:hypothetical protein
MSCFVDARHLASFFHVPQNILIFRIVKKILEKESDLASRLLFKPSNNGRDNRAHHDLIGKPQKTGSAR